jgi:hypothetical protein
MTTKTLTNDTLITTIDELGLIKAQIADLAKTEKMLKDRLGDLKPGSYEGNIFRLSVSETTQNRLDMDAVREHLSPQFIRAHTIETDVRTLRVVARNGKGVLS